MIPEIDIDKDISIDNFKKIFTTYGCALLTNILDFADQSLIDKWSLNVQEYFAQDIGTKQQILFDRTRNIGYQNWISGRLLVERFNFYKMRMIESDWPTVIDRSLALKIVDIFDKLTLKMLQSFDKSLESGTLLVDTHQNALNTTGIMYYPALRNSIDTYRHRGEEHTDWGTITFFWQLKGSGLQMQDVNENWHSVQYKDNSVVVCIGDTLQHWTNNFYRSTPHRVANDVSHARYSMPHFVIPQPGTLLNIIKPITNAIEPVPIEDFISKVSQNILQFKKDNID